MRVCWLAAYVYNSQPAPWRTRRHYRVIKTAQKMICHALLSLKDLFRTRCLHRERSVLRNRPGLIVFKLLSSGRRYWVPRSRTIRLRGSFYNSAITLINTPLLWSEPCAIWKCSFYFSDLWLCFILFCAHFLLKRFSMYHHTCGRWQILWYCYTLYLVKW